jgi:formylglycine-generating enzyme required for sulfatase activity
MYCERCNIEFQEGLRFCKWCGNTLTERRRVTSELHGCPSCAAPIQGNWAFCKACGVKLNAAVSGPVGEFCPRCGSKCDPTWQNCARCGEDMGRGKAHKHTAITSAPGRAVISHCSECGDKIEAGSTHCKGCGAAVYAPSAAFGASSLLCRVCNSYSPLGSAECRVCGAKFGAISETDDIGSKKKSSTLPDLDDHLPGSDYQASETVVIGQQQKQDTGEVISGAHTLIIGPSGAIEAPPIADEVLEDESSTGTAVIGDRPAGGAETTVLPGVAGSKSEQPSPTGPIIEGRTTGPVDEEPVKDTVEEEQIEVVKAKGRNPLSTQLDMPAIRLDELGTMIQAAEKTPAQPAEPEPMSNSTIVMGSISASEVKAAIEEEPEEPAELYRDAMTAPFGLQPPPDERDTQPEIPAQQAQDEIPARSDPSQHRAANTAEFGGIDAAWNAATPAASPPVEKTVTLQPAVTPGAESDRADYARTPSTTVPPRAQKKGPVVASIVATLIILAVCAFAVWWIVSGGPKTEPQNAQVETPVPPPEEVQPAPPAPPPTPAPPVAPEGMVYVPGGAYTIGRDDGDPISRPARSVTLPPFFIDRTEVTNAEYKKFIDATGRKAPSDWKDGSYPDGRDNWPVTNVSWQDATAYAEWIGKRLPTEAEWEAAARGTDKRIYPWGNEWRPGITNVGTKGITEVGQYKDSASPAGALDMIGNVWELTADEFKLYPGSTAALPPKKMPGIKYYVIRGGAFDSEMPNDATRRGFLEIDKGYDKTGFRLVKDAK